MGNSLNRNSHKPANNYEEIYEINENEKERRHLAHNILREIFGGNFSAPVRNILRTRRARVLEVGCGPGTWVLEMSSDYRGNSFIGLDMLSMFPETKPYCVEFVVGDVLKGLSYPDETFDYVFMRFLCIEFSEVQWKNYVIPELIRVLKPNGWLELMEADLNIGSGGPETTRFFNIVSAFQSKGISPSVVFRLPEFMQEIGLENVQTVRRYFPLGRSWGGRLGECGEEYLRESLAKPLEKFGKALNVKSKDRERMLE
ncbi:1210_t:CDS:2, partial [Acaulospora morrowiae]